MTASTQPALELIDTEPACICDPETGVCRLPQSDDNPGVVPAREVDLTSTHDTSKE